MSPRPAPTSAPTPPRGRAPAGPRRALRRGLLALGAAAFALVTTPRRAS